MVRVLVWCTQLANTRSAELVPSLGLVRKNSLHSSLFICLGVFVFVFGLSEVHDYCQFPRKMCMMHVAQALCCHTRRNRHEHFPIPSRSQFWYCSLKVFQAFKMIITDQRLLHCQFKRKPVIVCCSETLFKNTLTLSSGLRSNHT